MIIYQFIKMLAFDIFTILVVKLVNTLAKL